MKVMSKTLICICPVVYELSLDSQCNRMSHSESEHNSMFPVKGKYHLLLGKRQGALLVCLICCLTPALKS